MAQTAGGTYYAASSELVSSWPATSLDLANQLESRFAAKAPLSGAVLQVVNATRTTEFSSNAYNTEVFVFECAITPKSASSTIYALYNINVEGTSGGGRIFVYAKHGTTSGGTSGTQVSGTTLQTHSEGALSNLRMITASGVFSVAPGNTTTRYFKCIGAHGDRDTTATWYVSRFNSYSSITLIEVSA